MTIDDTQSGERCPSARLPRPARAARSRRSHRVPVVLALAALATLAPAGSIHAASAPAALPPLARSITTLAHLSAGGAALAGVAGVQATAVPGAGSLIRGVVRTPVTPTAAGHVRLPIGVPTALPVVPGGAITAPGLSPLQTTASSVTVTWSDQSSNELGFRVFERDELGRWRQVDQQATRDVRGTGDTYSWVDISTALSGQCYEVAAFNANDAASSAEECTVRPDPHRFPTLVPGWAPAWSGLSDSNDGAGELLNLDNHQQLQYADRTFGVNLQWANSSLWRIEAQGGPHLMKGEAVALKVWGGGWLMYGNETAGVDLQLSATPVYEWYLIGQRNDPSDSSWAGSSITSGGGTFALWNSSARDYLVASHQTWGVSLDWSNKVAPWTPPPGPNPTPTPRGVRTEQVFNCATDDSFNPQPVEIWIADLTAGGDFVDEGTLDAQYDPDGVECPVEGSVPFTFNPQSGHQYRLVATDSALTGCESGDPNDVFCQRMDLEFVGDANGCTESDTVDGGTQVNCAGLSRSAHRVKTRGRQP